MRNKHLVIAAVAAAIAGAACADDFSKQLTTIGEATMILEAKTARAKAEVVLLQQQREIERMNAPTGADPTIEAIEALGGDAIATLRMPNGSLVDARKGDVLPGGAKVTLISRNAVEIQTGSKRSTRLLFSGTSAQGAGDPSSATSNQNPFTATPLAPVGGMPAGMPAGAPASPSTSPTR